MQDRYLKCQMDTDQYVPITVIANFRKILSLTTDIGLITEALKGGIKTAKLNENSFIRRIINCGTGWDRREGSCDNEENNYYNQGDSWAT